jgi:hypothetical protein
MSASRDATPTEAVSLALECYAAGDWDRLATLVDRESVIAWRDDFLRANTYVPTVEELAIERPGTPVEVLERMREDGFVARRRRFEDNLPRVVTGVRTIEEVHALEPTELLARYVQAHDALGQLDAVVAEAYGAAGLPVPETRTQRPPPAFRPAREERISDTEARVSLSEILPDGGPSEADAEWMLRRRPGGPWRVVVTADFLCLPGAIAMMIDDPVVLEYLQS